LVYIEEPGSRIDRDLPLQPKWKMKDSVILALLACSLAGCSDDSDSWGIQADPAIVNFSIEDAAVVVQDLVDPPFLPQHEQVASGPPRVVNIRMEIVEREVEIAPGVFVWQMAFNNHVPGPVPVVFQWDWVNLTLVNGTTDTIRFGTSDNQLQHNIDFHAATGALGGGGLTFVSPGQGGRAALASGEVGPLRLSLRTRWGNGALSRGDGW
jgi:hypothetical protein